MSECLTPTAAGREYPTPVGAHTVTRHITVGVRAKNGGRIRLRAIRAPSGWRISREALDAFFKALTEDRGAVSTSASTEARVHRADAVLRASGW